MKLVFTKSFNRDYRGLPERIQEKVDKQLEFLLEDLNYPSLQAKKMKGTKGIWEARVSESYRFTFQIEDGYYFCGEWELTTLWKILNSCLVSLSAVVGTVGCWKVESSTRPGSAH